MKPPINLFSTPYEVWETRDPTIDEMQRSLAEHGRYPHEVKVRLIETIDDPMSAARHSIYKRGACNRFEGFIDRQLESSNEYAVLRQSMSSRTPKSISDYQNRYAASGFAQVAEDIENHGCTVGVGTVLFHGGFWPPEQDSVFVTERPFSTSFCPQIALRNAMWRGKAFDAGELHLLLIQVTGPEVKAFATRFKGTSKGHEKEVVFAPGATISLKNKTLVSDCYEIRKMNKDLSEELKNISVFILEAKIS
ncbi:hypothetical protein [Microbulbifer sp. ANSA005]|uniref:hypothetical protein n=1 Tax=Microbulbifer sp. ANSA005 TaxID=3243362 RepID=UPI00404211CE